MSRLYKFLAISIIMSGISCKTNLKKGEMQVDPTSSSAVHLEIADYKGNNNHPQTYSIPLDSTIDSSVQDPQKFMHFPDEDVLTDLTKANGFAVSIDRNGRVAAPIEGVLKKGCFPYLVDALGDSILIFDTEMKIDTLIESFYADYIIQAAGELCLSEDHVLIKINNLSQYSTSNSFSFLEKNLKKKFSFVNSLNLSSDEDAWTTAGSVALITGVVGSLGYLVSRGIRGKEPEKITSPNEDAIPKELVQREKAKVSEQALAEQQAKAATKIGTAWKHRKFRKHLASKEKIFLEDENVKSVLEKINSNEAPSKELLLKLDGEQLLFCFRRMLNKKNEKRIINFTEEMEASFEEALVMKFEMLGKGYQSGAYSFLGHLDQTGVKDLIEYYKILYPSLSREGLTIKTLFRNDNKWDDIAPMGKEGEYFFIEDISRGKDDGTFFHATMLYVNYDKKIAYHFNSLSGGIDEEISAALGAEFQLQSHVPSLQKDVSNCMVFAATCMVRIAERGPKFLEDLPNDPGILQSIPPEFVTMSQSLSLIQKYDGWFEFVRRNEKTNPEQLTEMFLSSNNIAGKKSRMDEIKAKLEEGGEFFEIDKIYSHEKRRSHPQYKNYMNILVERSQLWKEIAEIEGFAREWLHKLQNDTEFLARVGSPLAKLEQADGSIISRDLDGEMKSQNFLINRMKLRVLYYMATKSLKSAPVILHIHN